MRISGRKLLITALLLCGTWNFGHGAWIHAKALLAQLLLEVAWAETLNGGKEVKPWPWADTWPVCSLYVPRLGARRIVLAGANGATLAFGPGRLLNSGTAWHSGPTVIAGHRDTHFRFLKRLQIGDLIELQSADGRSWSYIVTSLDVIEAHEAALSTAPLSALVLLTCFPFDSLNAGGPLRYVVSALPHTDSAVPSL